MKKPIQIALSQRRHTLANEEGIDWEAAYAERLAARVKTAFEARRSEIAVSDLGLAVYIGTRVVEAVIDNAVIARFPT